MKLALARADLAGALGHVARVVERRTTIPILANVLLAAGPDGLRLRATDLDLEITTLAPAEVAAAGATTVPAATLHDIVRKLPAGGQVALETGEGRSGGDALVVRSGRSRFTLPTLPESDFPDLSAGEQPTTFTLPGRDLKRMIEQVSFAISTEETRYYLNGTYWHVVDGLLRFAATDGHRLARVEIAAPEGAAGMPGIIVPRKAAAEIVKLLGEDEVRVELSPAKVRLAFGPDGRTVLTSKLIDGTFPDYARVIPAGNDRRLTVDRPALAAALDRVATIASERGRAVKLALAPDGPLTLSVVNPDAGHAVEELDAAYAGDPLEIGFNARYLGDILGVLTGASVAARLAEPGSPTIFEDREGAPALYVLMPMRV